jgi:dipeptidyl aminopeptidase/acylaminoacyl peptidase
VLAAQGWNVLTLNPRGSDGFGEAFYRAAVDAWGEGDAKDFMEPLDQLIADGLADAEGLAVTGYSYGGFMTCWLTGHTDRFRSAVPGGLVSDHHAMNASSDLGGFLRDDPLPHPPRPGRPALLARPGCALIRPPA